jgi:endonuclease YncB( thermonuclease family)
MVVYSRIMRAWFALAFVCVSLAASAQTVAVTIVDGHTIILGERTYLLWGIEAADKRQSCEDGWPLGQEAIKTLAGLIRGHVIECQTRDKDRNGTTIALCLADGVDLGAMMLRAGMAWAFAGESREYVQLEKDARADRRGLHDHVCELPRSWRQRN